MCKPLERVPFPDTRDFLIALLANESPVLSLKGYGIYTINGHYVVIWKEGLEYVGKGNDLDIAVRVLYDHLTIA